MSVIGTLSDDKTTYTISVSGDFNFSLLHQFKAAYRDVDGLENKNIVIDLANAKTVDSSALGMLLAIKKDLNKNTQDISLINSNEVIGKILKITSFHNMFNIN